MVLQESLEENMLKGFIQRSLSPFAAPAQSGNKPDGGL